jgi:hypothetical protein
MAKPLTNFIFTDLAKTMPMQPDDMPDDEDMPKKKHKKFDGMAAGEFFDMYGRKTIFKKEELALYVKNTKAVLASTKDENGEIVGLPIDAMNHDHREASGWVVDVELSGSGSVIEFTPRWNDMGMGMIENDIARFFSPTVDIGKKVIMGGSLTNWPATRDNQSGKILLRPIELSTSMYELTDESLFDRAQRIARAFRDTFRDSYEAGYAWPVDVFEGYVICEMGEKLYKVEFSEKAGTFEFTEFSEWIEVKRAYVEAAMKQFKNWNFGLFEIETVRNGGVNAADQNNSSEETMPIKLADLSTEDRDELVKQVAAALGKGGTDNTQNAQPVTPQALLEMFNLQGASDEVKAAMRQTILDQYDLIQKQAQAEAAQLIANVRREANVTDLTAKLTGGDNKTPFGLQVKSDELKAWFLSLDPKQAEFATAMLTGVVERGVIDYREHGHGKVQQGTQPLPKEMAGLLKMWLEANQPIEEFFRVNADVLGAMSDYNLAEYQGKEK